LTDRIGTGKAVVLLGARQVGKTTLLRSLVPDDPARPALWLNADEARVRALFEDVSAAAFAPYLANRALVVIDEAQRVEDIGVKLKILQDAFGSQVQFVATGSSSFELANKINEPLTGRKWELRLHPLSAAEMVAHHGLFEEEGLLDTRLSFGWYPEVVTRPDLASQILTELTNDTLYKDIFALRDVRRAEPFERLVRALAYQIGSQVNTTELASLTGLDRKTVTGYIRLLKQAFIVFSVGSYSRNLRNELKASSKIYFWDVGVRNAVIGDFSPPSARGDLGHLFENFVVAELAKGASNAGLSDRLYFWRTTAGQEVDLVVESPDGIAAYEAKWNPAAKARFPRGFLAAYPEATTTVVNRANAVRLLAGA
jgi:predicted AAA+ superfamily ATPase